MHWLGDQNDMSGRSQHGKKVNSYLKFVLKSGCFFFCKKVPFFCDFTLFLFSPSGRIGPTIFKILLQNVENTPEFFFEKPEKIMEFCQSGKVETLANI